MNMIKAYIRKNWLGRYCLEIVIGDPNGHIDDFSSVRFLGGDEDSGAQLQDIRDSISALFEEYPSLDNQSDWVKWAKSFDRGSHNYPNCLDYDKNI